MSTFANVEFALLPEKRPPVGSFAVSTAAQSAFVLVLVLIGMYHEDVLTKTSHDYEVMPLMTTPLASHVRSQAAKIVRTTVHTTKIAPPKKAAAPAPLVVARSIRAVVFADNAPATPKLDYKEKEAALPFAAPSLPKLAKVTPPVQTGGFGDPNGVPANKTSSRPANIAQLGAFDLPQGSGVGNGAGGSRGARGTIASAGFGSDNATSGGNGGRTGGRGIVQQGVFGDADGSGSPSQVGVAKTVVADLVPAEVLSKPTPTYTEEGRRLHVEGEVLLEVVFEVSGRIRVLRVVRGLGHGLDESAIDAAEHIQFKPARHGGQPTDSIGVLRVVFQLA
jgi:TonB family protein